MFDGRDRCDPWCLPAPCSLPLISVLAAVEAALSTGWGCSGKAQHTRRPGGGGGFRAKGDKPWGRIAPRQIDFLKKYTALDVNCKYLKHFLGIKYIRLHSADDL